MNVVNLNTTMDQPSLRIIQASITVVDDSGKTRVISGQVLFTDDGLILLGSSDFRFGQQGDWFVERDLKQAA